MGSLLWLVIGLLQVRRMTTYVGRGGPVRLRGLDDARVRGLQDYLTGGFFVVAVWGGLVTCGLGVLFAVLTGDRLPLLGWLLAGAAMVGVAVLRGRASEAVAAEMEQRELTPTARVHSERRARRQRTFAVVAVAGFVVGQVAEFAGQRTEQDPLVAAGGAALLVGFVALAALAWTTVWVFGDESPDPRRT